MSYWNNYLRSSLVASGPAVVRECGRGGAREPIGILEVRLLRPLIHCRIVRHVRSSRRSRGGHGSMVASPLWGRWMRWRYVEKVLTRHHGRRRLVVALVRRHRARDWGTVVVHPREVRHGQGEACQLIGSGRRALPNGIVVLLALGSVEIKDSGRHGHGTVTGSIWRSGSRCARERRMEKRDADMSRSQPLQRWVMQHPQAAKRTRPPEHKR